jgi:hypothetical protein
MYAHGFLYAGDDESQRCPSVSAYAFDLLTGGGQYCYLDWRMWNEKFPYCERCPSPRKSAYKKLQFNAILFLACMKHHQ